jgi:hypothetical protein
MKKIIYFITVITTVLVLTLACNNSTTATTEGIDSTAVDSTTFVVDTTAIIADSVKTDSIK